MVYNGDRLRAVVLVLQILEQRIADQVVSNGSGMDGLPVVNFINILQSAFETIFFRQTITKPICNKRKALQKTFLQKKSSIKWR